MIKIYFSNGFKWIFAAGVNIIFFKIIAEIFCIFWVFEVESPAIRAINLEKKFGDWAKRTLVVILRSLKWHIISKTYSKI